jgi:ribulose-bisphosphate carboxylase large chain
VTRPSAAARGRRKGGGTKGHAASLIRGQREFRWRGVRPEIYKASDGESWAGIARHVLFAGSRGAPMAFDVRYFEIERGGYSTFERHGHAHVVIGLRGLGRVRLGGRWRRLKPLDACYIGPETPHQLRNDAGEPFGFLCLVDAERDRGRPLAATPRRTAR